MFFNNNIRQRISIVLFKKTPLALSQESLIGSHAKHQWMHEVVVKVVAIAVSTVMRMFRILLQSDWLLSIGQMIVESG